jgi:hypothetical protein
MYILGIDNGFTGAIAAVDVDTKRPVWIKDMPILKVGDKDQIDTDAVGDLLAGSVHVFIEKAQTMPAFLKDKAGNIIKVMQGASSSGRYMQASGIIMGACGALHIPRTLIAPVTWKKKMMPDMGKEKEASVWKCNQIFPGMFKFKKDHNKADALLLALYGLTYCFFDAGFPEIYSNAQMVHSPSSLFGG